MHGLWKYRGSLGLSSLYDGKVYAYVGDVNGTVIRAVEFDENNLDTTDTVIVANDTTFQN